jgi:hypothetical membrane protein
MQARDHFWVRLLLWGGILLPFVDLTLIAIFAAQHPDYSHLRHLMSELGETGRPWSGLVNLWFSLSSMLLVAFGFGMAASLPRCGASLAGVLLFMIWAALGVIGGFFPCDPGCRGETLSSWLHLLLGEIGAICILPVPALVWLAVRRDPQWRGFGWLTWPVQILVITLSLALAAAAFEAYIADQSLRDLAGLFQRLCWGVYYIWITALGIKLLQVMRIKAATC